MQQEKQHKAPPPQYFPSVDLLRGLAAVVVAFYHFSDGLLPKEALLSQGFHYGYLGVEAFFMISGFVIPMSFALKHYDISQMRTVVLKRIVRIEPAYWGSIALMLLYDTFYSRIWAGSWPQINGYHLFMHIFHLNNILDLPWLRAIYWTLAMDWQFYLVVCVFFFAIKRQEWYYRYAVYAVFLLGKWFTNEWYCYDYRICSPYLVYQCLPFLAGIVLFHYYRGYMKKVELAVLLSVIVWVHHRTFDYTHAVAVALCLFVILFMRFDWKPTRFLGQISYSFYLTHTFSGWLFISSIFYFYPQFNGQNNPFIATCVVILGAIVSVPFAKLFYNLVEAPTLKWAKKIH